ncbi:hypothetical protein [Trujillonella humicola]|uniref:hypothetical protein n=1 Tax=Trujillonella humicola TaxID=3383699 RepID=UPI0039057692
MTKQTTWAVLTAVLMIVWALAVGLLSVLADWTSGKGLVVAGAVSGAGGVAILWLRLRRLPKSPTR